MPALPPAVAGGGAGSACVCGRCGTPGSHDGSNARLSTFTFSAMPGRFAGQADTCGVSGRGLGR